MTTIRSFNSKVLKLLSRRKKILELFYLINDMLLDGVLELEEESSNYLVYY